MNASRRSHRRGVFAAAAWVGLVAAQKPADLSTFEKILENYTVVADLAQKPEDRPISKELFWKYPLKIKRPEFPIHVEFAEAEREFPATVGSGLAYHHLNLGRVKFLEGDLEAATKIWLAARARYGHDFPHSRRNDYFIGYAFLQEAKRHHDRGSPWDQLPARGSLSNAAAFLSWAFVVKKAQTNDPVVEYVTPKGLYNLAAVYHWVGRYAGAYGAAQSGIDYLRKTGRREFRPHLRRIVAESFIENRSYLEALQELDQAIRQDPDPKLAAPMFARMADVFFDLNNYELAEDLYALANRVDLGLKQISPMQLVLQGESLFWLGRFDDAQRVLSYAIDGMGHARSEGLLDENMAAYAWLRVADGYLARERLDEARLAYNKVWFEFRRTPAARIARIREACLDLPVYEGQNIAHARTHLDEVKDDEQLPVQARELAYACLVSSIAAKERTDAMVERVRGFADRFPESRFLKNLADPVREVQAGRLDEYLKSRDYYAAASFFETHRQRLFAKVDEAMGGRLFVAYVAIHESEKAREFYAMHAKASAGEDLDLLVRAAFLAEVATGDGDRWRAAVADTVKALREREWSKQLGAEEEGYVRRILAASGAGDHLEWVFNASLAWAKFEKRYVCDMQYPVLSRLAVSARERGGEDEALLRRRIQDLLDQSLALTLREDETCGLSMLGLEADAFAHAPHELAGRYLARRDLQMTRSLASLFWNAAEISAQAGDDNDAKALWKEVAERAPLDALEKRMASLRLDPTRSEVDQLWDQ